MMMARLFFSEPLTLDVLRINPQVADAFVVAADATGSGGPKTVDPECPLPILRSLGKKGRVNRFLG